MAIPHTKNKILVFLVGATAGSVVLVAFFLAYFWLTSDSNKILVDTKDLLATSGDTTISDSEGYDLMSVGGLEDLFDAKSRFEREVLLRKVLLQLNSRDIAKLFRLSNNVGNASLRSEIQLTTIERLATIDPEEALKEVENLGSDARLSLVEIIYREWASQDLDSSVEDASALDELDRRAALSGILVSDSPIPESDLLDIARVLGHEKLFFDHLARGILERPIRDSETSLSEFLARHGQRVEEFSNIQAEAFNYIVRSKIDADGASAIRLLADVLHTHSSRVAALTKILQKLDNDNLTLSVASSMFEVDREVVSQSLADWAESDPVAALKIASAFEEESAQARMQKAVLLSWAESNPTSLLDNLATIPATFKNWIQVEAFLALTRSAPSVAAERLHELPDGERKDSVVGIMAHNWAERDPRAALDWLRSVPSFEHLTGNVLSGILRSDRDMALHMALELPTRDDGVGFEALVISRIARFDDVEVALEMVNLARNEETLKDMYFTIGTELIRQKDTDRAMDLVGDQPVEWQSGFYRWVSWIWAEKDPDDMIERMVDLPSEDLRDTFAQVLLSQHSRDPFLDASQLEKLVLRYRDSREKFLESSLVEQLEAYERKSPEAP